MPGTAIAGLLEREKELDAATAALERARSGEGGVLVLHGPAGIGKTRLLDEMRAMAGAQGMRVLNARASQLETGFPFGVARQLCEPVLAGASQAEAEELLSGAAGLARPLLGLDGSETTDGEGSDFSAMHGLHWLVANLAERGPLALLVDDGHWADPDSLRFLAYLGSRIDGLPVLIATTVRTAEPGSSLDLLDAMTELPGAEVVEPSPLSEEAVATLAEARLGGDVASEFARACHEASGGNPFYCEELLASAAADGLAPDANAARYVAEIGPKTVGRAVLARLGRLPESCTRFARALSVLGGRSELRRVAELAGLDSGEAGRCADSLAEVQLLRPDRPLDFAHPIVRTSIYRSMGPLERAEMHSRAARSLVEAGTEPEQVAVHLLEIEPSGDPRVAELLRESAVAAADRGALQIAATHLERALAEPPPRETMAATSLELGLMRLRTGVPEAPDAIRRAVESAAGQADRDELALRAARALGRASQAEAVRVGRLAVDEGGDAADETLLRLVAELIPSASLFSGSASYAWELLDRHEGTAPEGTAVHALMAINRAWATTVAGGSAAETREQVEQVMRGGALAGELDSLLIFMAVAVLLLNEGLEPAAQLADAGIEQARARGWPSPLAAAQWLRANIQFRLGNLAEAGSDAAAAVEFTRVNDADVALPWSAAILSDVNVEQGKLADAEAAHALVAPDVELPDFTWAVLIESRGRLRLAQGDLDRAVADLREAGARWESIGMANLGIARWRADAAVALAKLGEGEEARALASAQLESARGSGARQALGMALRTAGVATEGDAGIELLRESVVTLDGSGARLEHAHAAVALGSALRRAGQRSDARPPLNEGLALARAAGATPLAELAFSELQATGARPRKVLRGGLDALTPSEHRVARMAADGLQNKEIAQTLFITVRTVETHLRHVYLKLDIDSREKLTGALETES
jgi:DNA-binding CsgD family transcriptional regulator/tetratricopeptide (TPR) repeat protein